MVTLMHRWQSLFVTIIRVSWKREYDDEDLGVVDASIVGSHIMFTAADIGLGTTWIAHFDPAKVRKAYNLPDNIIPVAIFPIGYPHPDCVPAPGHTKRLMWENLQFIIPFKRILFRLCIILWVFNNYGYN